MNMHSKVLTRKLCKILRLRNIAPQYQCRAFREAQKTLTDYLHSTRCLPFAHAENISKNSPFFLTDLLSKVEFTTKNVSSRLQSFLRYHPINEYEFFLESIGFSPSDTHNSLPSKEFFLAEDGDLLQALSVLIELGFPWNKIGWLYKEESSIFGKNSKSLKARFSRYELLGFSRALVIGISFAFPFVLIENDEHDDEINGLLNDLKQVFLYSGLKDTMKEIIDESYQICRKIKLFYDMGCEKGKLGSLFVKNLHIFIEYSEKSLRNKLNFFCRLEGKTIDCCMLLLHNPEIWNYDLENPVISVLDYLKYAGLDDERLKSISELYPYALGITEIGRLPEIMRALDLHNWFFDLVSNGNHHLLSGFDYSHVCDQLQKDEPGVLPRIKFLKDDYYLSRRFLFLLENGFGENGKTIEIVKHIHGCKDKLQERFNHLLRLGIKYSNLCKMIYTAPKIINQNEEMLEQKIKFLCEDLGLSLNYLDIFPAYLCFDLENRIKPRYKLLFWLKENNLFHKSYKPGTVLATSEKSFISRLSAIHPAVPKLWLESFSRGNCLQNGGH